MKQLLCVLIMTLLALQCFTQNVAINEYGTPPDPSAMLDVSSIKKGVLVPRMTTGERQSILNPAQGLLVFDTDTRTFWFYSNGWNDMGAGAAAGPAAGDLNGFYPAPDVVKIQNMDVSPDIPAHHKVLKWDAMDQKWRGLDDGLTLPYAGQGNVPHKLFSVTNGSDQTSGVSIHGKYAEGSNHILPNSTGIWGENKTGDGVTGTSHSGYGIYGISNQNHGIYGYNQEGGGNAGVFGKSFGSDGIGVLGEMTEKGVGVFGKGIGPESVAGRFENQAESLYPALDVRNWGNGMGASIMTGNTNSSASTLVVSTFSSGHGIFAVHDSIGDSNSAIRGWHLGHGDAIHGKSHKGTAGRFVIDNFFSEGHTLHASTIGNGSAGVFTKQHVFGETAGEPAVFIDNYSKEPGLKVRSNYPSATTGAVEVEYSGYGYAVEVQSSSGGVRSEVTDSTDLAIVGIHTAEYGTAIQGIANAFASTGVHGTANGFHGVGVLGTSVHPWGYGVRGENSTGYTGAVTGVNSGGGPGVLARNNAPFGYGMIAETGPEHGVAGKFESSNPESAISPAIWAHSHSKSTAVQIYLVNEENDKEGLLINHSGTGPFTHFVNYDHGGDVTMAANGNITTSGALTVKDNKGIVRNSASTQMRYETKTSAILTSPGAGIGVIGTLGITFGTPFSAPPVVTIANVENVSGSIGQKLLANISDVTTTGCTITIVNPYMGSTGAFSAKWTVMAVGAE